MSFPAWVFSGFVALSVWAVALYLLREETPQHFVPFLRNFEVSGLGQRRERWARRLRHPLSLLLLIVLLAALSWALLLRGLETAEPRLLSLVVDVSRKMELPASGVSGPTRFELSQKRAEQLLKSLSVGQEAMLIEAGARARLRVQPTTDIERILRELKALDLEDTEAALAPGLQLSEAVAKARPLEVVVLTHGEFKAEPRPSTRLKIEQLGAPFAPANLAIRSFSARRYPLGAGQFEAVLVAESSAPEPTLVRATLFSVDLAEGQRSPLDVAEFELAPRATRPLVFRAQTSPTRALECQIERVDGEVEASVRDNVGRALLPEERALKILIVGKESLFLTAALLASGRVQISHALVEEYPPRGSDGASLNYDLTIFRDLPKEREARTGPAIYFARPGPGLPVALGKPLKMFGFDESDRKSKLFRFFDPFDTQILDGNALVPESSDRVLASSGGLPLVVSGERARGPFLAIGFAPESSDMVLRSAFPLFVRGLLEELLGEVNHELLESSFAGEPLKLGGAAPTLASAELRGPLFEPEESREPLRLTGSPLELELTRAGFYELRAHDRPPSYFAVNARPVISDSTPKRLAPSPRAGAERSIPPPTWISWVIVVLGLGLLEYYSYHRRWTV